MGGRPWISRPRPASNSGIEWYWRTLDAAPHRRLNLQFNSRIWNSYAGTASLYADQPFQSGWDATRGQSGTAGIEYPGRERLQLDRPVEPLHDHRHERAGDDARAGSAHADGANLPWHHETVERQGDALDAFTDPNFLCSSSYRKPGQYTTFSGYEKARQWNIDFAGEHCSQDFQGFMEGGASEGLRAASEVLADLKKM